MNKKHYNTPASKVAAMMGQPVMAAFSRIDPDNKGGSIDGGETNSNTHPLDAKRNVWDTFDDEGDTWDKF